MRFLSLIKAGQPLMWIRSHEESRVLQDCTRLLKDVELSPKYEVYTWDVAEGTKRIFINSNNELEFDGDAIEGSQNDPMAPLTWLDQLERDNVVLFLLDYHPFLEKGFQDRTLIVRTMRDMSKRFKAVGKALVLLSGTTDIPTELDKDMPLIDYKLPNKEELKVVLKDLSDTFGIDYPANDSQVLEAALGLTVMEAETAFAISFQETGEFDHKIVLREKIQVARKSGILEVIESDVTMNDIGSLEIFKAWASARAQSFSPEAIAFGVKPPKGVLLNGVQGCGKSLTIKALAAIFGWPILKLDMGNIHGKYVGDSEHNMQAALDSADAQEPCILWIDEGEKNLAGNKAGMDSHETTRRCFSKLLTWMQEHKTRVLTGMTTNSVDSLPPELLRSGRIDAKFWVDLPDAGQREEILAIHLRKVGRNISMFQGKVTELVAACEGFSGADIECWVGEALNKAFAAGHNDITVEDMLEAKELIVPISRMAGEDIARAREWAMHHGFIDASMRREPVTQRQGTPTRKVVR